VAALSSLIASQTVIAHPTQADLTVDGKRATVIAHADRSDLDVIAFDDGTVAAKPRA